MFNINSKLYIKIRDLFRENGGKWNDSLGIWTVTTKINILEKIKALGYDLKGVTSTDVFPKRKPKKIKVIRYFTGFILLLF